MGNLTFIKVLEKNHIPWPRAGQFLLDPWFGAHSSPEAGVWTSAAALLPLGFRLGVASGMHQWEGRRGGTGSGTLGLAPPSSEGPAPVRQAALLSPATLPEFWRPLRALAWSGSGNSSPLPPALGSHTVPFGFSTPAQTFINPSFIKLFLCWGIKSLPLLGLLHSSASCWDPTNTTMVGFYSKGNNRKVLVACLEIPTLPQDHRINSSVFPAPGLTYVHVFFKKSLVHF